MNNDFHKNAYAQIFKYVKTLLSNCHQDEYLIAWICEGNQRTPIIHMSYLGNGMVALTTNRKSGIVASLQALQVHFEYVDKKGRTPECSFQIEEPDPDIQA